ncbi:hypothetical protein [Pseudoalteromonas sp. B160]|uniref:hypothetical protein n=1 Tax=Pseudoalteromonas sp. B160 TaxID=630414 RepID=UPI00301BA95D
MLAGGLSILETSANPYVMGMGNQQSATRRLNLAQSFNPVGTNIGVFLAATLILPSLNIASSDERAAMSAEQLTQVIKAELDAVMVPYVGMACVLVLIWLAIAFTKTPNFCKQKRYLSMSIFVQPLNDYLKIHIIALALLRSFLMLQRKPVYGPLPFNTLWKHLIQTK